MAVTWTKELAGTSSKAATTVTHPGDFSVSGTFTATTATVTTLNVTNQVMTGDLTLEEGVKLINTSDKVLQVHDVDNVQLRAPLSNDDDFHLYLMSLDDSKSVEVIFWRGITSRWALGNTSSDVFELCSGAALGTNQFLSIDQGANGNIYMKSNDSIEFTLDQDNNDSGTYTILNGTGASLFRIGEDGATLLNGNTNIGGTLDIDDELTVDGTGESSVAGNFHIKGGTLKLGTTEGSNPGPLTILEVADGGTPSNGRKVKLGTFEIDYDGTSGSVASIALSAENYAAIQADGSPPLLSERRWNLMNRNVVQGAGQPGDFWIEYKDTDASTWYQPFKISNIAGDDALVIGPAGNVSIAGRLSSHTEVTTINTAGNVAYTASQILSGLILRDCVGSGRSDTIVAASTILDEMHSLTPVPTVGSSFRVTIRNTSDGAETITLPAGTVGGVTISGDNEIAEHYSRTYLCVFTNVGSGTEACTLYSESYSIWD